MMMVTGWRNDQSVISDGMVPKPCPFCGGEPGLFVTRRGHYYVNCTKCGAGRAWYTDESRFPKFSAERAVEAWNTRDGIGRASRVAVANIIHMYCKLAEVEQKCRRVRDRVDISDWLMNEAKRLEWAVASGRLDMEMERQRWKASALAIWNGAEGPRVRDKTKKLIDGIAAEYDKATETVEQGELGL